MSPKLTLLSSRGHHSQHRTTPALSLSPSFQEMPQSQDSIGNKPPGLGVGRWGLGVRCFKWGIYTDLYSFTVLCLARGCRGTLAGVGGPVFRGSLPWNRVGGSLNSARLFAWSKLREPLLWGRGLPSAWWWILYLLVVVSGSRLASGRLKCTLQSSLLSLLQTISYFAKVLSFQPPSGRELL